MPRYTWKDGHWRDKEGHPMDLRYPGAICAPLVMKDTTEYRSPIDGRLITSRSQRREDLIRNNCVEVDPPKKPRGFKNARFAKKHGLPLNPELVSK